MTGSALLAMIWRLAPMVAIALASAIALGTPAQAAEVRWLDRCAVAAAPGTRCGELTVLERRDRPHGRTIVVPIAIVPAPDQAGKAPDPLLFLMGGTGGGFSVLQEAAALPALVKRDVIVVEQRGNALATPFFGCESVPPSDRLHRIWVTRIAYAGPASVVRCKAELRAKQADLYSYMTPAAADDLVELRQALGIESWNVYGVSYGGRVATALLRKDPAAVRTMILDSPQVTGARFSGWDRLRALGAFFDHCAAAQCGQRFPGLRATFEATVARLDAAPAPIMRDGTSDRLAAIDYVNLLVWALYDQGPQVFARVPAAIVAAGRGDYAPLLATRQIHADRPSPPVVDAHGYPTRRASHIAQQIGVFCGEEFANLGDAGLAAAARHDGWSRPVVAVIARAHQVERNVCRTWNFAPSDHAQALPPTGNAPTLVLYGDYDTIAPSFQGRIAVSRLTNAQLVVFDWTGHAALTSRLPCAAGMIAAFLARPGARVDAACAHAIAEPVWVADMPSR